jgi:hypothetical protein
MSSATEQSIASCKVNSLKCKLTVGDVCRTVRDHWKGVGALGTKTDLELTIWNPETVKRGCVFPWDCILLDRKQARQHRRMLKEEKLFYPRKTFERIQEVMAKVRQLGGPEPSDGYSRDDEM